MDIIDIVAGANRATQEFAGGGQPARPENSVKILDLTQYACVADGNKTTFNDEIETAFSNSMIQGGGVSTLMVDDDSGKLKATLSEAKTALLVRANIMGFDFVMPAVYALDDVSLAQMSAMTMMNVYPFGIFDLKFYIQFTRNSTQTEICMLIQPLTA